MDKNTEFKNQRIVNVKYIMIGKDIPVNRKPNPLKKNISFWVNKFEISNKFPKTIKIVEIIFSKKTRDLRFSEKIAIKSSPAELFLFIIIFNNEGLKSVPALINKNKETKINQTVDVKDSLKIEMTAATDVKNAKSKEMIAKNLNIALLLSVVTFDCIKSEHAPWKSFARKAKNKTITGPKIASGKTHPVCDLP